MAFQHNDKQGSLFKNEKTNDRQPDYRGSIMINGVNYNLSAWLRTSKNGLEYISLQASEPNDFVKPQNPGSAPAYNPPPSSQPSVPPVTIEDMPGDENDLPF